MILFVQALGASVMGSLYHVLSRIHILLVHLAMAGAAAVPSWDEGHWRRFEKVQYLPLRRKKCTISQLMRVLLPWLY